MRGLMVVWCVAVVVACVSGAARGQVSPFEDVEWSEAGLERVMVRGEWWEPVAIEGVSVAALCAFAEREYGGALRAQKRVDEDLLEVMERFGEVLRGDTVRLELRPVGGGEVVNLPGVVMTRENRQRLWSKRIRAAEEGARAAPMREVLTEAAALLAERHSYSVARGLDAQALSGMVELAEDAGPGETVRAARRMLAVSGDGHARVRGKLAEREDTETRREGVLPVSLMPLDLVPGGRVVAVEPDGAGLVSTGASFCRVYRWGGDRAVVGGCGGGCAGRVGAVEAVRGLPRGGAGRVDPSAAGDRGFGGGVAWASLEGRGGGGGSASAHEPGVRGSPERAEQIRVGRAVAG
ncbi:MAG: hypothetical protein HND58_07660 [Planctomycetota bacterium]|nr:MAG: hypothetical protein HND58_07660 [Planctomycetota bacterium]